MKKISLLFLLVLGILFFYGYRFNNIVRLNNLYDLNLNIFYDKEIYWKEDWDIEGDGHIEALIEVSKDKYDYLKKRSSNKEKCNQVAKKEIILICKKNKEEEITIKLVVKGNRYFVFYRYLSF